jgi:hypothetical protein
MQRAFEEGYTRMKLINANGIVAVNIGFNMRQAPDQAPANDYTIDISPTQDSDLTCDTSSTLSFQYNCHVSLFITIPNFERTITLRQKQMGWLVGSSIRGQCTKTHQRLTRIAGCSCFSRSVPLLCTVRELGCIWSSLCRIARTDLTPNLPAGAPTNN